MVCGEGYRNEDGVPVWILENGPEMLTELGSVMCQFL